MFKLPINFKVFAFFPLFFFIHAQAAEDPASNDIPIVVDLKIEGRRAEISMFIVYRPSEKAYFVERTFLDELSIDHSGLGSEQSDLCDDCVNLSEVGVFAVDQRELKATLRLHDMGLLPTQEFRYTRIKASKNPLRGWGAWMNYRAVFIHDEEITINSQNRLDVDESDTAGILVGANFSMGELGRVFHQQYEISNQPTYRVGTYFQHDFRERLMSLRLGDIVVNGNQIDSSRAALGLSLGTDFDLQPDLLTEPTFRIDGEARRPSTVEVFYRNRSIQQEDVDAGTFRLSGIPGAGRETVYVVVKDEFGTERVLEKPLFYTKDMLDKGRKEWNVSIGAPRLEQDEYGGQLFTASMRYGLEESLTVEGYTRVSQVFSDALQPESFTYGGFQYSSLIGQVNGRLGYGETQFGSDFTRYDLALRLPGFSTGYIHRGGYEANAWEAAREDLDIFYVAGSMNLGRFGSASATALRANGESSYSAAYSWRVKKFGFGFSAGKSISGDDFVSANLFVRLGGVTGRGQSYQKRTDEGLKSARNSATLNGSFTNVDYWRVSTAQTDFSATEAGVLAPDDRPNRYSATIGINPDAMRVQYDVDYFEDRRHIQRGMVDGAMIFTSFDSMPVFSRRASEKDGVIVADLGIPNATVYISGEPQRTNRNGVAARTARAWYDHRIYVKNDSLPSGWRALKPEYSGAAYRGSFAYVDVALEPPGFYLKVKGFKEGQIKIDGTEYDVFDQYGAYVSLVEGEYEIAVGSKKWVIYIPEVDDTLPTYTAVLNQKELEGDEQ